MNHLPVPLEFSGVDSVLKLRGWKKSGKPVEVGSLHPRWLARFLSHQQYVPGDMEDLIRSHDITHVESVASISESVEGNSEVSPVNTNKINENNKQPDYNLGINRHILR